MFKFLKNIFNYGIGGVLSQLVSFLLIPIYTRYLIPSDYGILELCTSLSLVIIPIMRLGLPGAITRYYFDYKENDIGFNHLVSTTYKFLILFSLGLSIVTLAILYFSHDILLVGLEFYPYILLVLLTCFFMAPVSVQRKLIIARSQSALSAKINVFFSLIGIGFSIVAVILLEIGVVGIIMAQLFTAIIAAIYALYYLKPNLNKYFNTSILKENIKYGLGIFPHHMMVNFSPFISRLLLASYGSLSALGLFSIAVRFNQPLSIFFSALTPTFQPLYFSIRENSESVTELMYYIKLIILIGISLFGIFINVMPDLIPILLYEKYHFAGKYVPIIGVSLIGKLYYLIFSAEIFYLKKTQFISVITFVGIGVNVLLSMLFVEKYGVFGISWAFSISYLCWGLTAFLICRKVSKVYSNYGFMIIGVVIAVLLFLNTMMVEHVILRYSLMFVILLIFTYLSGLGNIKSVIKKLNSLRRKQGVT